MYRRSLLLTLSMLMTFCLSAQNNSSGGGTSEFDILNYRTIDGRNNNLSHPDWGAAGTNLLRLTGNGYADGISQPGGQGRPNPREVSNEIFAQNFLTNDYLKLNDFCWVFGQFLDHDLGLTPDGTEPAMISVPAGDPFFDPNGEGRAVIPMLRNTFDPATGDSPDNPRQHPNLFTSFIDASAVYGSDEESASWLRSFEDGKLKVSANNFLPYNTIDGERDSEIDYSAPHMDNPTRLSEKLFVAGDPRANENPLLLSFHTLFVREHNRVCDVLKEEHPDWSDERLYQHARKYVGGFLQSITYNEWLPAIGLELPEYEGYKEDVHPQLLNIFTAAAFRMGHTLLNGNLLRLDTEGNPLDIGHLALRDAFFDISSFEETGDLDPFFQGMAAQMQQQFDAKIIDDVRNFLFGAPGAGGLDLATINIARGRERGLPDFNSIREHFGLTKYVFFQQMDWNYNVLIDMVTLYRNVNRVDPWVGMLVERPRPGNLFGETLMKVFEYQFTALRDGDRFFYENDPVLTEEEKEMIRNTRMYDVLMRNTSIESMQLDVFRTVAPDRICEENVGTLFGRIFTPHRSRPGYVRGVNVEALINNPLFGRSNEDGEFEIGRIPGCDSVELTMSMVDNLSKGVSTFDLIQVQKHILGAEPLGDPYAQIAADVDRSNSISTIDLILIRKIILGKEVDLADDEQWLFVEEAYEFKNPEAAFEENLPSKIVLPPMGNETVNKNFIGIKLGDVDASASNGRASSRSDEALVMNIQNDMLEAGQVHEIRIHPRAFFSPNGMQWSLVYDAEAIEIVGVESMVLPGFGEQHYNITENEVRFSWNSMTIGITEGTENWIKLKVRAKRSGALESFLYASRDFSHEAYSKDGTINELQFEFADNLPSSDSKLEQRFMLMQNEPNPFFDQTRIRFSLAEEMEINLKITDALGRVLWTQSGTFGAGEHQIQLSEEDVQTSGLLYYSLETKAGLITKEMIKIK